jgi:acyl-CoA dehydrogenase
MKHFISTPCVPDFAIVFAATGVDDTPRGPRKRVTAFLVDRGEKGFTIQRGPTCAAQRAYRTYELSFDDCRVNRRQILGEEGKGLELSDKWLGMGRVWVAAQSCGKAERLLELATDWAATRKQFGKPIGSFQGMTMHACRQADNGLMRPEDAAMAKLYASEMVGRVADHTVQIFGGMGLMEEMPIERLWRDARIERIWDGTSEIQRHIIARSLLRPLGA